jgi:hypothetical protein
MPARTQEQGSTGRRVSAPLFAITAHQVLAVFVLAP